MMANRDAWYRLFVNRAAEFAVFAAGHAPIVVLNDRENAASSKAVRRDAPGNDAQASENNLPED